MRADPASTPNASVWAVPRGPLAGLTVCWCHRHVPSLARRRSNPRFFFGSIAAGSPGLVGIQRFHGVERHDGQDHHADERNRLSDVGPGSCLPDATFELRRREGSAALPKLISATSRRAASKTLTMGSALFRRGPKSERVFPVDVPLPTMMKCILKWGPGSGEPFAALDEKKKISRSNSSTGRSMGSMML